MIQYRASPACRPASRPCAALGANDYTPEITEAKIYWRMPLKIRWKIPVEIHWKSDNPLERTPRQGTWTIFCP